MQSRIGLLFLNVKASVGKKAAACVWTITRRAGKCFPFYSPLCFIRQMVCVMVPMGQ